MVASSKTQILNSNSKTGVQDLRTQEEASLQRQYLFLCFLLLPHVTRDSLVLLHFHNVVFGENWYHGVAKFVAGWVAKMFLGWGGKTALWIG